VANILLGVTGSVAALKTPELVSALLQAGHAVKVIATEASLYFFDREQLPTGVLHTDADEWPRQGSGIAWQRSDTVLHIELRRWADLFLIAPLDANTLAKLAFGLSDNALTCVWRAWDQQRPIILAPAMNTLMWEHPMTVQHLRKVAKQFELKAKKRYDADALVVAISEQRSSRFRFVGPIPKLLACGDMGQGAMAEVPDITQAVTEQLTLATTP
jgi:phosphopantothenoylcysteine decarboxylase